jgi:hypothetical protein
MRRLLSGIATHILDRRNWIEAGTHPAAWLLWLVVIVAVCIPAARGRGSNSVTQVYRDAATAWIDGRSMYPPADRVSGDGWIYPPLSVMVFVPKAFIERGVDALARPHVGEERAATIRVAVGDVLWRVFSGAVLVLSLRRLARLLCARGHGEYFFMMTLLAIPASLGSLYNGQVNVLMAGAIVMGFVGIAERRWWSGAAWLTLAVVCKPAGVVGVLLAGALWPGQMWRLVPTVIAAALLPMLMHAPAYVLSEYRAAIETIRVASGLDSRTFADLGGMLTTLGLWPGALAMTAIRVAIALGTLGLCWSAVRRLGPVYGAAMTMVLCAASMLLLSPRTEGNTYVLLGPGVGMLGALCLLAEPPLKRAIMGYSLVIVSIVLGVAHAVSPALLGTTNDSVLRPVCAIVVFGCVAMLTLIGGGGLPRPGSSRRVAKPDHAPSRQPESSPA